MLGMDDRVVPIHPEEQEMLQKLGGEEHIIRYSQGYLLGGKLVVTEGPMKGLEGFVKWTDRHQRLAGIELFLLGRKVTVRMGVGILKKISEEPETGCRELRDGIKSPYRKPCNTEDDGVTT